MKGLLVMKIKKAIIGNVVLLAAHCALFSVSSYAQDKQEAVNISGWDLAKSQQSPINNLAKEFNAPFRQPVASLGWEDGVYITRDGLTLYAQYTPIDLFQVFGSFVGSERVRRDGVWEVDAA